MSYKPVLVHLHVNLSVHGAVNAKSVSFGVAIGKAGSFRGYGKVQGNVYVHEHEQGIRCRVKR